MHVVQAILVNKAIRFGGVWPAAIGNCRPTAAGGEGQEWAQSV